MAINITISWLLRRFQRAPPFSAAERPVDGRIENCWCSALSGVHTRRSHDCTACKSTLDKLTVKTASCFCFLSGTEQLSFTLTIFLFFLTADYKIKITYCKNDKQKCGSRKCRARLKSIIFVSFFANYANVDFYSDF